MELISSAERNQLVEACEHTAFHLELRDDYSVPDENGPFQSWLRGDPVDHSFMEPWLQMVKRLTGEGRTVRRVRVVTEPHTPYIEWEHATTALNVEAGEEIRWLPRHQLPEDSSSRSAEGTGGSSTVACSPWGTSTPQAGFWGTR